MTTPVVAIDGPAGAGKGTLARRIAAAHGFAWLDTGMIYRAVAARLLDEGGDSGDAARATFVAAALVPGDLERDDLRREAVGEGASRVAAIGSVRRALLDFQRRFAASPPAGAGGAVLDGRDVGTVVCPDAPVKLFVTASVEERARRRLEELLTRGVDSIYARVLADLRARDERDSGRDIAPLRPADDAVVLDTTNLDIDAAFEAADRIVRSGVARGGR